MIRRRWDRWGFVSGMRLRHGPKVEPMPVDPKAVGPLGLRNKTVQALTLGAVLAADGGPLVLIGAVSTF